MSPSGWTLHPVMVQLGDALEQCLMKCSPYLWEAEDPQPGSPWDLDRQHPRPPSADPTAPDLSDHPHVVGYWYAVGGADAMLGVQACLSSDAPLSVGALSRVAMEAFAWGAWIWEPVGAHNSVVGADQGFRAASRDQESVRDSGHEDSASARIAAGQRPRPSFRHPHASSPVMRR